MTILEQRYLEIVPRNTREMVEELKKLNDNLEKLIKLLNEKKN